MIKRTVEEKVISYARQYPVVTITGPRQSGKTTLCKKLFKSLKYLSLENLTTRQYAQDDPVGFLAECTKTGAIIDEIQRAPDLPSYIQGAVDQEKRNGLFVLTGSQNFELMTSVSQSLAGRTALVTLLPFSYNELYKNKSADIFEMLYQGFYPRIFDQKLNPTEAMSFYVSTYLERDIRTILNVKDLSTFEVFLKLCAARNGQILNFSAIANDCGINHNTAKQWISVLEASHIIYLLKPHYKNFNKRLIKAPKLYFLDVGLAAYLLEIENSKHFTNHPLRGALFEAFVVSELLKKRFNSGKKSNLYYFRDNIGNEVDVIADKGTIQIPIEIKSGKTINEGYFKGIEYYYRLNKSADNNGLLVYGGEEKQKRTKYRVIPYKSIHQIEI
ncbi:ATP-binding protein [bacterium]|nr:ATP-binding protein [bacterium]